MSEDHARTLSSGWLVVNHLIAGAARWGSLRIVSSPRKTLENAGSGTARSSCPRRTAYSRPHPRTRHAGYHFLTVNHLPHRRRFRNRCSCPLATATATATIYSRNFRCGYLQPTAALQTGRHGVSSIREPHSAQYLTIRTVASIAHPDLPSLQDLFTLV